MADNKPALMDATTYQSLLEKLLGDGEGYGKTRGVGAYLLPDLKLVTETASGKGETTKNVSVEKLYVVMDLDLYQSEDVRKAVVKDIARRWGDKTVRESDLDSPDFKGPGLWTIKKGSFEFDYLPQNEGKNDGLWKPNPEAFRVTLTTDGDINIPVQWGGGFVVETGGTIAIREKDVKDLADALQQVRAGTKSAHDALFTKDKSGAEVTTYDIYGMNPGFLQENYNPVSLKAETAETTKPFKAPSATMPALKLKNAR